MHEVLVNRLGGLSLPMKSVVRLTDRLDMTLDVYRGRKTTMQHQSSRLPDRRRKKENRKLDDTNKNSKSTPIPHQLPKHNRLLPSCHSNWHDPPPPQPRRSTTAPKVELSLDPTNRLADGIDETKKNAQTSSIRTCCNPSKPLP